jgi:hypothetical protein
MGYSSKCQLIISRGTETFELALGPALEPSPLPLPSPGRRLSGARIVEWGEWNGLCQGHSYFHDNRATRAHSLSTSFHAALVQLPFTIYYNCNCRFRISRPVFAGSRRSHWLDGDESLNSGLQIDCTPVASRHGIKVFEIRSYGPKFSVELIQQQD